MARGRQHTPSGAAGGAAGPHAAAPGAIAPGPPPAFAEALSRALADEGLGVPAGTSLADHVRALGAPMRQGVAAPREIAGWGRALDAAVAATLDGLAPDTYAGLGWAMAAYRGQSEQRRHREDDVTWRPGEPNAARSLREVWPQAYALSAGALPAFWSLVLNGRACAQRRRLLADVSTGDTRDLVRVAQSTEWRLRPPFADDADEWAGLLGALRAWRAGVDVPDPVLCTMLDVPVTRPETLEQIAAFGRVGHMRVTYNDEVGALSVSAHVRLEGAMCAVRGHLLTPAEVHAAGVDALKGWARAQQGAIAVAPEIAPLSGPGILARPPLMRSRHWVDHPLRTVAPGRCAHEAGRWAPNASRSAMVLSCPTCGRTHIARCWRDELPETIPERWVTGTERPLTPLRPGDPAHDTLLGLRAALALLIDVGAPGQRWPAERFNPARWASVPVEGGGQTRVSPAGSPEALLLGRRGRARRPT